MILYIQMEGEPCSKEVITMCTGLPLKPGIVGSLDGGIYTVVSCAAGW